MDDAVLYGSNLAATVIKEPTDEGVKELALAAANAALTSPEIRKALTQESVAALGSLGEAANLVLSHADIGKLAAAAKKSAAAFAAELGMQAYGTAMSMALSYASTIPGGAIPAAAVGAFLALASAIAAPLNEELAKQAEARARDHFLMKDFLVGHTRDQALIRPRPTGPRGENRPADLFAWQSFAPTYRPKPPKGCTELLHRGLLGYALIKLTESGLDTFPVRANSSVGEEPQWDLERPRPCGVMVFPPISRTYYPTYLAAVRERQKNPALGIPENRRLIFRLLRRAIQAQHNRAGTDGGASLWPAYMDMLAREFAEGHLTPESIVDFLHVSIGWDFNNPSVKFAEREEQLSPLAAMAIPTLVDNWKLTMAPVYAQDQAERAEANKLLVALSKVAAASRLGKFVDPKLLEAIPPEFRSQFNVAVRPSFKGVVEAAQKQQREAEEAAQAAQAAQAEAASQGQRRRVAVVGGTVVGLGLVAGAVFAFARRGRRRSREA